MEDSTSATDATVSAGQGPFTAPSLNGHGVLSEGSLRTHGRNREQGTGNREQGTGTSPSADADGFPAFWAAYPRKIRKVDASKAYAKALKRAGPQAITAGLERHLPIWEHTEPGFIPHAATWLNGDRWEDEPTPSRARPSRPPGIPEGW